MNCVVAKLMPKRRHTFSAAGEAQSALSRLLIGLVSFSY